MGAMIAEAASRAARGHVLYMESECSTSGWRRCRARLGRQIGWDGNAESTLNKLKANGIAGAAATAIKNFAGCGSAEEPIAEVRHSASGRRLLGDDSLHRAGFARRFAGRRLCADGDRASHWQTIRTRKLSALNLVQGEDGLASMQNFSVHMQMLNSLRPLYPQAHLTLACRRTRARTGAARRV